MPYTLHIANKNYSSWSLRPWALLRELQIPFEEQLTPFGDHAGNAARFGVFSPTAKVPVLVDNDITIWESLAIVEYLAERHEGVWPQDAQARTWARCATAEMHAGFSALRQQCPMNCSLEQQIAELPDDLKADIQRLDALWCEGFTLFGGPFLTGMEFTAVDAFFAPVVFRCQGFDLPLSAAAESYVEMMLSLDSMQEWRSQALLEAPEPGHEADSYSHGTVLHDLRG